MKLTSKEVLTVPNALTASRAAALPWLYGQIRDNPGGNWWKAGVFAATDKLDGSAKKLGDRFPGLQRLGFRGSELGRKGDPVVDTIFGAVMLVAGMRGKAIPRTLGVAALVQKAGKAGISADAERRGIELEVSSTGKVGEAVTVIGFGLRMGAEGIRNPYLRTAARLGADALALAGVGMATTAAVRYARESGRLPAETSPLEESVEAMSAAVLHLPRLVLPAASYPDSSVQAAA